VREVGAGIAAIIVLVVVGTHVWGGPIPVLWVHAMAHDCAEDAASRRCVDTLPAEVTGQERAGTEVDLTLAVRGRGELRAALPSRDAERLAVADGDTVRAAVLGDEVLRVTGDNGEQATTHLDVTEALLRFAAVTAGAIAVLGAVALVPRRVRRGTWWFRHAAGSAAFGTAVGVGAASLASQQLAMPVLYGVTVLASLAGAYAWLVHLHPAVRQR
jgi:hypothetical protein